MAKSSKKRTVPEKETTEQNEYARMRIALEKILALSYNGYIRADKKKADVIELRGRLYEIGYICSFALNRPMPPLEES